MATTKEFCSIMEDIYANHGVYIGTGNGELTLSVAGKFFEMEKKYDRRDKDGNPLCYSDTARDYEYLAKCYRNKWDMSKSIAGDCSGIIVYALRKLGLTTSDYRARDLQKMATKVSISSLQPGDLVFNELANASHVGVYIGCGGYVIHSKGRDAGVVREKLGTKWLIGGRLDWFTQPIPPLTREIYYNKDGLMRGEDVRQAQERLKYHGCDPGKIDGVYGLNSEAATIEFQVSYMKDVKRLGTIGKKTWAKLWED